MSVAVRSRAGLSIDRLACDWQQALDAAEGALDCSGRAYEPVEMLSRRGQLGEERRLTAGLLERVARVDRVPAVPWLSPVPVTAPMLGLPPDTEACVFDLDGVLTDSGRPLAGARRYLEAVVHAGLGCGVVSASRTMAEMLEFAGLSMLVDAGIDAAAMHALSLRSRPAPDVLFAVCARLDVDPAAAVTFTHSLAGVAAGRAAGLGVVGVGDEATLERLHGFGAERVVQSLSTLLDRRLQAVP